MNFIAILTRFVSSWAVDESWQGVTRRFVLVSISVDATQLTMASRLYSGTEIDSDFETPSSSSAIIVITIILNFNQPSERDMGLAFASRGIDFDDRRSRVRRASFRVHWAAQLSLFHAERIIRLTVLKISL